MVRNCEKLICKLKFVKKKYKMIFMNSQSLKDLAINVFYVQARN